MVTTGEIQKYILRHLRPEEDPIDPKTQDRTTLALAQKLKNNEPLPKGRCNLCGWEDDRLIPGVMKICLNCCRKFIDRGGGIHVWQKNIEDYHCDFCMSHCYSNLTVNVLTCIRCSNKIGHRHKYDLKDVRHEEQRIEKKKENFGVYGVTK